jgi:hypothetical protein
MIWSAADDALFATIAVMLLQLLTVVNVTMEYSYWLERHQLDSDPRDNIKQETS